ncbi:MAG: DUF3080 family protein [Pseudomonadota bacterium]
MTSRGAARLGLLALLPVLLAGCWLTGERERQADAYVTELADALAVAPKTSSIPTVEPLPHSRHRSLALPELDMGLVDFLSLYGCELQVVIGERTSTLGRVANPGTRMEYHLRFLQAADECLPKVESESRSETLREARSARAESLPLALWNGIWASEEMADFVSRSGGTLPVYVAERELQGISSALEATGDMLASVEPGRVPAGLASMNDRYRQWREAPRFGQLLRSAEALQTRLGDGARTIEQGLVASDGCPGTIRPEAFFRQHYLDQVAQRVRLVRRHGRRMADALDRLVHVTSAPVPEAMTPFIERNLQAGQSTSVWHDLDQAAERHASAWNRLLSRCD